MSPQGTGLRLGKQKGDDTMDLKMALTISRLGFWIMIVAVLFGIFSGNGGSRTALILGGVVVYAFSVLIHITYARCPKCGRRLPYTLIPKSSAPQETACPHCGERL